MAKLVYSADIMNFKATGEKTYYIEEKTIITPSAKDLARQFGIQFSTKKPMAKAIQPVVIPTVKPEVAPKKDVANKGAYIGLAEESPRKEVSSVDYDLRSIQEARDLVSLGSKAAKELASFTEEQIDRILVNMVKVAQENNVKLAQMAVEETGFGKVVDKTYKNHLGSTLTYEAIKNMKTIGIIEEDPVNQVISIAEPMGLVLGIIPSTNPTSTTMFKALIAIKGRNSIVFSPHPSALKCTLEAANLMRQAAVDAGAPANIINCVTLPSMNSTNEMMKNDKVDIIIATGGPGLVKAAYSSGKPALGVGAGNTPAYIERTADVAKAVQDIVLSKTFDNGTICASEQAVVVEECIRDEVIAEFKRRGAYFMTEEECKKVCNVIFINGHTMNGKLVGRDASVIAQAAGISIPQGTTILIGEQCGVGKDYPLSYEKLLPVLGFYTVKDWKEACNICIGLLQNGIGHTLSLHTRNKDIVREFSVKPASRILVNTGSSQGGTGASTGLIPSFTLGCGTWGGSSTTENVSPMHLLNIKKVAYGIHDCATLASSDPLYKVDLNSITSNSVKQHIPGDTLNALTPEQLNAIVQGVVAALKGR